jgi:hypothetical protein
MVFQPASAKGGQAITISLVGFPADRAVTLRWGSSTGSALANTTTDSAGQALATFTVPSVAAGGYVLYATGTQTTSVFEDFRVSRTTLLPPPTVGALTPGTGTPGTFVRVHAGGLRPNEVVTTIVGGAAVDQSLASSSGSIDVPIIVPAAPNGALPVQVVGAQSGVVVSQSLNVAARLVLVPSAGHAGSSLSADAFGFPAGAPITILWDGSTVGSIGSGNSDPFGSAAVAATVPSGAAGGAHDATATGGSTAASSTFTVN